jgi:hypothetical protein
MRKIIARRRLLRGLAKREIRPEIAGKSSFGIGHNQGPPLNLPSLKALDLERHVSVLEAAQMMGISADTFKRHYRHLIRKPSPRRCTVKLRDVLSDCVT